MADNNTYTSKQNVKKYTTQAKFDAIDKSDVPVGTEYNIVGSITESDLDSDLQAKVNLAGDNLTTEVTGGKVKVKNPMTSTGGDGFKLNSFYNESTGVTYFFPIETPIGHFATGIVPILGSTKATLPGLTSPATYHGLFLQNAYTEDNYGQGAFSMISPQNSYISGNQIYILPYCSSNPGVSYLLNNESIHAGTGIVVQGDSAPGSLKISLASGSSGGIPEPPLDSAIGFYKYLYLSGHTNSGGTTYEWNKPSDIEFDYIKKSYVSDEASSKLVEAYINDGTSSGATYVLLIPTTVTEKATSVKLPAKSGTLATLDDIPTGGTTYTAGKNIAIDGTTIKTKDDVNFDTAIVNALTVATTGIFTRGPINRVPQINFGTSAEPLTATGVYSFANIFTAFGETKTTYNFKIPSVGGVADIRFPNITYGNLVAEEQLKTIFGNQSLVGSGNIDLYQHIIHVYLETETLACNIWFVKISSSNLKVDSLTDLKTLLGNSFKYPVSGPVTVIDESGAFVQNLSAYYITENGVAYNSNDSNLTNLFTFASATTSNFVDEVTTV